MCLWVVRDGGNGGHGKGSESTLFGCCASSRRGSSRLEKRVRTLAAGSRGTEAERGASRRWSFVGTRIVDADVDVVVVVVDVVVVNVPLERARVATKGTESERGEKRRDKERGGGDGGWGVGRGGV